MQKQNPIDDRTGRILAHPGPNDVQVLVESDLLQVNLQQSHNINRSIQRHLLLRVDRRGGPFHIQCGLDKARLTRIMFSYHGNCNFR